MRRPTKAQSVRSWVLLIGGIAGIAYETVHEKADRPWLFSVFLLMMGLPVVEVGDDLLSRLLGPLTREKRDREDDT